MDFLSGIGQGLGNIFHSIGHFFTGGGGDSSAPTTVSTTTQAYRPNQAATQTASSQERPFSPDLNLFQGVPLQKANPQVGQQQQIAADFGAKAGFGPNASPDSTALVKAAHAPTPTLPATPTTPAYTPVVPHTLAQITAGKIGQQFGYTPEAIAAPPLGPPTKVDTNPLHQAGATLEAINENPALAKVFAPAAFGDYVDPEANTLTGNLGELSKNLPQEGQGLADLGKGAEGAAGLVMGAKNLIKAAPGLLAKGREDVSAIPEVAGEIAEGIKSINPNQAEDALKQTAGDAGELAGAPGLTATAPEVPTPTAPINVPTRVSPNSSAIDTPAYQRQGLPEPVRESPLDIPTFQRNDADQIVQKAQDRVDMLNGLPKVTPNNSASRFTAQQELAAAMARNPQEAAQLLRKQLLQKATASNDPAASAAGLAQAKEQAATDLANGKVIQAARDELNPLAPPPTPTVPEPAPVPPPPAPTPALVHEAAAEGVPTVLPAEGAPESPAVAAGKAEAPQTAPTVPEATGGLTAPNAPNVRAQFVKQLGEAGKAAGDVTKHNVLTNADLNTAAQRAVESTPDTELLSHYSGVPNLSNAADLAHGNASLQRLAELAKSPDTPTAVAASKAIDNVMEGAEKATSGAGRTLNYAQSMYDTLPKEAKISLTIRTLDKARDAAGMPKIADDLPLRAQVEATLDNLLSKGEDIRGQLAGVEGKIEDIRAAVGTAELPADASKQLDALGEAASNLKLEAQVQNGETARYYDSLVPGKAGLQKAADWAKTSMLTAPSGRINNVFNVGGNTLYETARSIPQAIAGKVVNAIKGPGTATDSSLLQKGLFTGAKAGLKKVVSQMRGNATIGDLKGSLGADKAGGTFDLARTADNRGLNKIANITKAAVKAPGEIIGGAVKQAQLERSARQEGEALGHTGNDLKVYTQARSLVPSKQMADRAQQLQEQVSHTNKNWLSDQVGKIFGDTRKSGNAKGAFGLVKNTFLPFPKYAATFVWNTLTDRNIVADAVRAGEAVKNGDIDGLTKAISGAAVNGTGMYLGYHLTQQGIITNKDGQGYSDGGAYLHLGNRYIPLGTIGVGAESLLAGNAMHNAVNGGGNPADMFAKTVGDTVLNTIKTAGAQNIVGSGDTALTGIQNALAGKETAADAGAQVGAQAVGQFIPGAFSDVNAGLNSTPLNPTHEASDTKVIQTGLTPMGKQSTAKDIGASTVKSLENRVPFLSQTLPRKAGVAAADLLDRVTRGSQGTPAEADAAATAKAKTDQTASDKAGDIPDPASKDFSTAVEAHIQNGKYDNAIKGLQQKMTANAKDPNNIPKSANDSLQKQITTLGVLKDNHFDPSIRDLYKTSLTNWRNMGDPENDAYDPAKYKLLYSYDVALAKAGVSGNTSNPNDVKYTPKALPKGRGSSALEKAKSNTINPTELKNISFGNLAPQKVSGAAAIPTIQNVKPGELVKQRAISVTKVP